LEGTALLRLQQAAAAQARADAINDPKRKADYEGIARTWRKLARGYEFQGFAGTLYLVQSK
jgi:hypothetical protein